MSTTKVLAIIYILYLLLSGSLIHDRQLSSDTLANPSHKPKNGKSKFLEFHFLPPKYCQGIILELIEAIDEVCSPNNKNSTPIFVKCKNATLSCKLPKINVKNLNFIFCHLNLVRAVYYLSFKLLVRSVAPLTKILPPFL